MAYLQIQRDSIIHNVLLLKEFCGRSGISLCAVTKCCCSEREIIQLLLEQGISSFADSNMSNFAGDFPSGNIRKNLIKTRLTDIREIARLPRAAVPERVFVSDETLLQALSELPADICPDIVLIIEVGDLKEGFFPGEDRKSVV